MTPWRKIGRFIVVGGGVTALNYVLYTSMIAAGFHYLVATTVGWSIGVTINFMGNKYWTFMRRSSPHVREVSNFAVFYFLQLLIGSVTLTALVEIMRIDVHVAFFINVAITALMSYVILDRLVFAEPPRTMAFAPQSSAPKDVS